MKKLTQIITAISLAGLLMIPSVVKENENQNVKPLTAAASGETATYTITGNSKAKVTTDCTLPNNDFTVSTNADSDEGVRLSGKKSLKHYLLTVSGYKNLTINSITLGMKSNGSSGAGGLSYFVGSTETVLVAQNTSFNDNAFNGAWSTLYVDLTYDIGVSLKNESFGVKLYGNKNSIYVNKIQINYSASSNNKTIVINDYPTTINSGYLGAALENKLTAIVTRDDSTTHNDVTWSSSDSTAATIDETGAITFLKNDVPVTFTATAEPAPAATITITAVGLKENPTKNVEKTIATIADENKWGSPDKGNTYREFAFDNIVSVTITDNVPASEANHSGLYTTHNGTEQISLQEEDTLTLSCALGYKIQEVTVNYYQKNNKSIKIHNASVASDVTAKNINSPTVDITLPSGATFIKIQTITIKYTKDDSLIPTKATVDFKEGKGTYCASDRKDQEFSSDDLIISLVNANNNVLSTIENGLGFTISIQNTNHAISLDATSSLQTQSFAQVPVGEYNLTVTYKFNDTLTFVSEHIVLKVIAIDIAKIELEQNPKLNYTAFTDTYTEFDGGKVKLTCNDNSYTGKLDNFVFTYKLNNEVIDVNTLLNQDKTFNVLQETTIEVVIKGKDYQTSEVQATYNIVVAPLALTASDAHHLTYYTNTEYTMEAEVLGNGALLDPNKYTITPATVNEPEPCTKTITVALVDNPTITTTYDITIEEPKGTPVSFVFNKSKNINLTYTSGDIFAIAPVNDYGVVTYKNNTTEFKVTSPDNLSFYLSEDEAYSTDDENITFDYVLKVYDKNKFVIPSYTEAGVTVYSDPIKLTVNVKALPTYVKGDEVYTLLNDPSTLQNNDKILITNLAHDKALGGANENNRSAVTLTTQTDDSVKNPDQGVSAITLLNKNANGAFNLKTPEGYLYAGSNSGNQLKTSADPRSSADALFTISLNNPKNAREGFKITCSDKDRRGDLRFNESAKIFSCYNGGQKLSDIYLLTSTTGGSDPAEFIIETLDTFRLNAEKYLPNQGYDICYMLDANNIEKLNELKTIYNNNLKNVEFIDKLQAIDKYGDGINTYQSTLVNLISKIPAQAPGLNIINSMDSQTKRNIIIITCSVVGGLLVLGGFGLFIKKRKFF